MRAALLLLPQKQSPAGEPGFFIEAYGFAYFVNANLPNWFSNGL